MPMEEPTKHSSAGDTAEALRIIKAEVDALQVRMMAADKPWYRQASTLIAVLALTFSFGTTAVSFYRTAQLDKHAAQVELRGLLQRIVALPRENFDTLQKYQGQHLELNQLAGYVNNENIVLAQQAHALLKRIPRDRISGAEYYAVAQGLISSGVLEPAIELFQAAADEAETAATAAAAHRSLGAAAYNSSQIETGRRAWEAALAIFETRFKDAPPAFQNFTHTQTLTRWAQVEGFAGHCHSARDRLEEARRYLSMLPEVGAEPLLGEIEQTEGQLMNCRSAMSQASPTP